MVQGSKRVAAAMVLAGTILPHLSAAGHAACEERPGLFAKCDDGIHIAPTRSRSAASDVRIGDTTITVGPATDGQHDRTYWSETPVRGGTADPEGRYPCTRGRCD